MHSNGDTDVYSKPTNTGQYTHFDSFTPWGYKISWARALFNRATRICSSNTLFQNQRARISKILSWNGFPTYVRKKLMKQFADSAERKRTSRQTENTEIDKEIEYLSLKIPYMGPTGDKLVRTLKRKIAANLSRKVNIRVIYTTNKLSKFCSTKDRIPEDQRNNVIYLMRCPGCGEKYVGKTNCCFGKRMDEQGTRPDQPLHQHLSSCEEFNFLIGLNSLPNALSERKMNVNTDSYIYKAVKENTEVIAMADDWLTLAFMEPLLTKKHKATINHGERAMKSLNLF